MQRELPGEQRAVRLRPSPGDGWSMLVVADRRHREGVVVVVEGVGADDRRGRCRRTGPPRSGRSGRRGSCSRCRSSRGTACGTRRCCGGCPAPRRACSRWRSRCGGRSRRAPRRSAGSSARAAARRRPTGRASRSPASACRPRPGGRSRRRTRRRRGRGSVAAWRRGRARARRAVHGAGVERRRARRRSSVALPGSMTASFMSAGSGRAGDAPAPGPGRRRRRGAASVPGRACLRLGAARVGPVLGVVGQLHPVRPGVAGAGADLERDQLVLGHLRRRAPR